MKLRPIFLGILFAVIGVVLLLLYLRRYEQEVAGGSKVELLVTVAPIERGKPITNEMLGTRQVPQAYVDDRAIRASERDKILNLRAAMNVPVLQTLAWSDLIATTDDQRDLSSLVQPGNRAMPIRVQFDDVLPMIRPGDFIDIIHVGNDSREASVLLQRVLVLATGMETATDRSVDRKQIYRVAVLTLSVSLQESQLLALAMGLGKLTVVLRNPDDQRVGEAVGLSSNTLFDVKQRQSTVQGKHGVKPIKLEAEVPR